MADIVYTFEGSVYLNITNSCPCKCKFCISGLAGIALWINTYYRLPDDRKVDKNSKLVTMIKEWVDEQYDEGRVTTITDNELVVQITDCCKKLNIVL